MANPLFRNARLNMQELPPLLVLVTFCVLCGQKSFRRLGPKRGTQGFTMFHQDGGSIDSRKLPRGFGPVRSETRGLARKRRVVNLGAGEDLLDAPSAKAVLQLLCFQYIYIYMRSIFMIILVIFVKIQIQTPWVLLGSSQRPV